MHQKEIGNKGEVIAIKYLKDKGYDIIARNFHSKRGEIDIVAKDKDTVCFVEVKYYRKSLLDINYAVSPSKQKKIIATAKLYISQYKVEDPCRFDIVLITGDKIEHLEGAFFV